MFKFLLVFILFHSGVEQYRDQVMVYATLEECQAAKKMVREAIIPEPSILFALECVPLASTTEKDA